MIGTVADISIQPDAPIPTWFGIGGRAERLARPESVEQLRRCLEIDPALRVLGDGANLLVDDDGVGELVVSLASTPMTSLDRDEDTGLVVAMAGANLPKLIVQTVRLGLAGLESLAGIPATIGGAVMMNAGGAFGQIADVVARVNALDRQGRLVTLERVDIDFSYRHSGLDTREGGLIVTSVELSLRQADPEKLRDRFKEVMAYKKASQPMAENSAGCVFKNPTLPRDLDGIGPKGKRASAGMLIDRAGCKGLAVGGAQVSDVHANFIVTRAGALARHVIELMADVRRRVADRFGVTLEPEVVVWSRRA